MSILLYGCTTWTLTKCIQKKLDGNYTRMLRAVLNKSWRQHSTKQQLYRHLPPITKTVQVRRTRLAGHCWRSKDELISDVLLWTPSHGRAKAGRPARTYLQLLFAYTGCSLEDLSSILAECSAGCLASVLDGQCSMADLKPKGPQIRLGHLRVGELQHWHFCHLFLALDLAVQFKL